MSLHQEIWEKEPKEDLLHQVCNCGKYVFSDICRTSDGFYLGMAPGDIGFNAFLGKPSETAKTRTGILYGKLSKESKVQVMSILIQKGIPAKEIGISLEE